MSSDSSSLLNALGTESLSKDQLAPDQDQVQHHGNLANSVENAPRNGKNITPPCDQSIFTQTQSTQNPESKEEKVQQRASTTSLPRVPNSYFAGTPSTAETKREIRRILEGTGRCPWSGTPEIRSFVRRQVVLYPSKANI